MIYIDPGNRRVDTMTIVGEGLAFRHYVTGEFKLVAKACGYLDLALKNLAEFYEAGVIEPSPRPEDRGDGIDWDGLRWTKTGHYLWKQWQEGPPRRVVTVAQEEQGIQAFPDPARSMLLDAGWTITAVWRQAPLEFFVVHIGRNPEQGGWEERVLVTNSVGYVLLDLPRAKARMLLPMFLAATL